jgi:hypothetical protein
MYAGMILYTRRILHTGFNTGVLFSRVIIQPFVCLTTKNLRPFVLKRVIISDLQDINALMDFSTGTRYVCRKDR